MLKALYFYQGNGTNPYDNLALEAYFFNHCPPDSCILYLWQNRQTVVIGKNQNAWKECDVDRLEAEGGFLARRPSGGGAVFHDLGNLNFTFVAPAAYYDISRQLEVICRAVKKFGLDAQKTGRNDIVIGGRKFSGNAFQNAKGFGCHHGTLLIDVDTEMMARYLTVSQQKLHSKGVDSVKARVVNLKELCPDITVESLSVAMKTAFGEVYGLAVQPYDSMLIDWEEVRNISGTFASWQWRLGREIPFSYEIKKRFDWGEVQLLFSVNGGMVQEVQAFSDAMDTDFIAAIPRCLRDLAFSPATLADALEPLRKKIAFAAMAEDLQQLLRESPREFSGGERK